MEGGSAQKYLIEGFQQNTDPLLTPLLTPLKIIGKKKCLTNQVHKYDVTWSSKMAGECCNSLTPIFFCYKVLVSFTGKQAQNKLKHQERAIYSLKKFSE